MGLENEEIDNKLKELLSAVENRKYDIVERIMFEYKEDLAELFYIDEKNNPIYYAFNNCDIEMMKMLYDFQSDKNVIYPHLDLEIILKRVGISSKCNNVVEFYIEEQVRVHSYTIDDYVVGLLHQIAFTMQGDYSDFVDSDEAKDIVYSDFVKLSKFVIRVYGIGLVHNIIHEVLEEDNSSTIFSIFGFICYSFKNREYDYIEKIFSNIEFNIDNEYISIRCLYESIGRNDYDSLKVIMNVFNIKNYRFGENVIYERFIRSLGYIEDEGDMIEMFEYLRTIFIKNDMFNEMSGYFYGSIISNNVILLKYLFSKYGSGMLTFNLYYKMFDRAIGVVIAKNYKDVLGMLVIDRNFKRYIYERLNEIVIVSYWIEYNEDDFYNMMDLIFRDVSEEDKKRIFSILVKMDSRVFRLVKSKIASIFGIEVEAFELLFEII